MSSFKNSDSKNFAAFQQTNSPKKNAPIKTDAIKNAKFQGQKTDFQQAGYKNPNRTQAYGQQTRPEDKTNFGNKKPYDTNKR